MSAFVKITSHHERKYREPAITIGRISLYFNRSAQQVANMHVMKSVELFWDEDKRILMLKPSHQELDGSFVIRRPNLSTCMIGCPQAIRALRGDAVRIHARARWNDEDRAFYVPGEDLK